MARLPDPDGVGNQASCDFWEDHLFNLKVLLNATVKAITALQSGTHQSYELDTGQSRQRVTRLDLDRLNAQVDDYTQRISDLELKLGKSCGGSGSLVVVPGW
jgi:hypothetical protein